MSDEFPEVSLDVRVARAGRALLLQPDGAVYASRHYGIYRTRDAGQTWERVTALPCPAARRLAQASRLACRVLRHEVRALNVLSNGALVASNRQGVFYGRAGDPVMARSAIDEAAQPVAPPMTITVGPNDRILWGEYDSHRAHGKPVRLYVSQDGGKSYRVAHVFEGGSLLHVHNLIYDPALSHYWVLTGDHEHEPGIGRLSADLRDFEWVHKGEQRFRAVEMFDFGDRMVYATDTEVEPNGLMSLDKATGRLERLREFEGSCIYACRFGGLYALTTTVERSRVNHCAQSGLWLSRDGERWRSAFAASKDRWHGTYFQYGSLVLPRGAGGSETIMFSGQALKGIDGKLLVGNVAAGS